MKVTQGFKDLMSKWFSGHPENEIPKTLEEFAKGVSILPQICSDGEEDDEVIVCTSIAGGAAYYGSMPKELSLDRVTKHGEHFSSWYINTGLLGGDVSVSPSHNVTLRKLYNGIIIESDSKESLGICLRDGGFEFTYAGVLYSAKDGEVFVVGPHIS